MLGKISQTYKNKYYIPYEVKAEAGLFRKMKRREQGTQRLRRMNEVIIS